MLPPLYGRHNRRAFLKGVNMIFANGRKNFWIIRISCPMLACKPPSAPPQRCALRQPARITSVCATIRALIGSVNPTALLATNSSECYAITNFLEGEFRTGIGPVTANDLAAAVGEDGRSPAEIRPVLTAALRGEPSYAPTLWKHAAQDRSAATPSGISKPWVRAGLGGRRRRGRKSIFRNGAEKRQFWALGFSRGRRRGSALKKPG
jgi:hypothetical protein